ncbi:uncharacterized protein LOC105444268 [Strongylocentrotus purpuratus]|uniref:Uncharacterized protein n=1 Tax=Strongylocentrotus purpuratus TaxID=7668 RepID=A0A7M7HNW1_STRPU|nr:uncharacterized protein LOC105444268 [Strongylocentrotus purpuratus]
MDDSDMEILGIPLNSGRPESKHTLDTVLQSSKSAKKSVKDKLKETETFHHHHTAASKSSHCRKKRRKSHAERNNKKKRHEKANGGSRSECQKHLRHAQDMTSSNKMEYPMMSDPHKHVPLITQSRITTSLGMYNKAKKSDRILRDLKIPDAVRIKTQESLLKILDVSEANLPPAPNLDSPLMLDDMGLGLVQVVQPSSPEAYIQASRPVAVSSTPNPVAVIPSHMDQNKGLSSHRERAVDLDITHTRNHILPLNTSPELSPVSEAAEMMQSSFNLNSVFPGRDHPSTLL